MAAVVVTAAEVTAGVASMVVVDSTVAAAFMVAEVSTAEASMSEGFTAGDFMVVDFTAVLFMAVLFVPFTPLRGQDAVTARIAFKPALKSTLPAPAIRMFPEVPSRAATAPQIERSSATPAR